MARSSAIELRSLGRKSSRGRSQGAGWVLSGPTLVHGLSLQQDVYLLAIPTSGTTCGVHLLERTGVPPLSDSREDPSLPLPSKETVRNLHTQIPVPAGVGGWDKALPFPGPKSR